MVPHLDLAQGHKGAVLADEMRSAQVRREARLEAGDVVALGALVELQLEVHRVDVVSELLVGWISI